MQGLNLTLDHWPEISMSGQGWISQRVKTSLDLGRVTCPNLGLVSQFESHNIFQAC